MQRHNHRNRKNQKKRAEKRKLAKAGTAPPERLTLDAKNTHASKSDPRFHGKIHPSFI